MAVRTRKYFNETQKECRKCSSIKMHKEFSKAATRLGGLRDWCKKCESDASKKYHRQNSESICKRHKKNREEKPEQRREYELKKRHTDPVFKLKKNLRRRLNSILKGKIKKGSSIKMLGCSPEELKVYLESKFKPGMSWDNYSFNGFHIDHIIPLSSFDLTDLEQLKQACHYTNLQPLWAKENFQKSDKISLGGILGE